MFPRLVSQPRVLAGQLCRSASARLFSTNNIHGQKLRIGYVPEHFATPLHFAQEKFGLAEHADIEAFPSGTGTMIEAFKHKEIDVGIGLTEAWVVGLSKTEDRANASKPYHMVGSYTMSPLLWAISTGGIRADLTYIDELKGLKVGISRFGSGSHIMASVLAQTQNWPIKDAKGAFEFVQCGPFGDLREAVNHAKADFFMWEHFTSKRYYDEGILKRLGDIETPWNAWHIAALGDKADPRISEHLIPALEKGVKHFQENKEDALDYISTHMPYSREDASEWYEGVRFANRSQMTSVSPGTIEKTLHILETAGVLGDVKLSSFEDVKAEDSKTYA